MFISLKFAIPGKIDAWRLNPVRVNTRALFMSGRVPTLQKKKIHALSQEVVDSIIKVRGS